MNGVLGPLSAVGLICIRDFLRTSTELSSSHLLLIFFDDSFHSAEYVESQENERVAATQDLPSAARFLRARPK